MKKFMSALVMLAFIAVTPASAQSVLFGVQGGVTRSSLSFDKDIISTKGRYGWFVGPTIKVGLPLFFGIDAAALYDQRQVKINDENVKIQQISIPVNLRADFNLVSTFGIYAALGPQFSFNVGDSEFKLNDTSTYSSTFQLKKSAFSMNFGAGIMLLKQLEVGAAYNVELGNTSDISWGMVTDKSTYKDDSKLKSWRIHATIYF